MSEAEFLNTYESQLNVGYRAIIMGIIKASDDTTINFLNIDLIHEVIYSRLTSINLGAYCSVIESIKTSRLTQKMKNLVIDKIFFQNHCKIANLCSLKTKELCKAVSDMYNYYMIELCKLLGWKINVYIEGENKNLLDKIIELNYSMRDPTCSFRVDCMKHGLKTSRELISSLTEDENLQNFALINLKYNGISPYRTLFFHIFEKINAERKKKYELIKKDYYLIINNLTLQKEEDFRLSYSRQKKREYDEANEAFRKLWDQKTNFQIGLYILEFERYFQYRKENDLDEMNKRLFTNKCNLEAEELFSEELAKREELLSKKSLKFQKIEINHKILWLDLNKKTEIPYEMMLFEKIRNDQNFRNLLRNLIREEKSGKIEDWEVASQATTIESFECGTHEKCETKVEPSNSSWELFADDYKSYKADDTFSNNSDLTQKN